MSRRNEPYLILGLSSGKQLRVDHVMLFPESELLQVLMLKAKARELITASRKGAGFPETLERTAGSTVLQDFYEAAASNGKAKKGLGLLNKAAIQHELLRSRGEFFPVSSIDEIETPRPEDWKATQQAESRIDLNDMTSKEKSVLIEKYGLSRKQITKGMVTLSGPTSYVHDGGDFIGVVSEGKAAFIRWSAVDYYELA